MHAWLCENPTGVEALQWKELPTPEPKQGQVRVAIRAAIVNPRTETQDIDALVAATLAIGASRQKSAAA